MPKITVTTDQGIVIEIFDVDRVFGDIEKPFPAGLMKETVVDAVRRARAEEAGNPKN